MFLQDRQSLYRWSIKIDHQFGLILNCGISRLNKETTQQRMLLPQAEEAAGATYSLETGSTTRTCRPGWSSEEDRLELMQGMENGQSALKMNFL